MNKRLVFCGLGKAFQFLMDDLAGIPFKIVALLDNDTVKQGSDLYGIKIEAMAAIQRIDYDLVVLSTPFDADIASQLAELGVENNRLIRLGASYSFGCTIFETYDAQMRLKNKNFTLIANDCWGGIVYSWLGVRFYSPFINLIVPPPDFLKLAEDTNYFLRQKLCFNARDQNAAYPIGSLDTVKIHFVHDQDCQEAKTRWERRLKRINLRNVFYKFETDEESLLLSFDCLAVSRKIAFTRNPRAKGKAIICLPGHRMDIPQLHRTCLTCRQHIDLVKWFNTGIAMPPSAQNDTISIATSHRVI